MDATRASQEIFLSPRVLTLRNLQAVNRVMPYPAAYVPANVTGSDAVSQQICLWTRTRSFRPTYSMDDDFEALRDLFEVLLVASRCLRDLESLNI